MPSQCAALLVTGSTTIFPARASESPQYRTIRSQMPVVSTRMSATRRSRVSTRPVLGPGLPEGIHHRGMQWQFHDHAWSSFPSGSRASTQASPEVSASSQSCARLRTSTRWVVDGLGQRMRDAETLGIENALARRLDCAEVGE